MVIVPCVCHVHVIAFTRSPCGAGDGGGISFASPQEFSRNVLYCTNNSAVTPFREWTVNSSIAIQHSVVSSNAVSCNTCSGGGLSINPGGSIRLVDSVVINNSAEFFGGGIYLGGTSPGIASCSFSSSDSMLLGNAAQRGGGQLYNNCGGSVEWMNTTVDLGTSTLEVCYRTSSSLKLNIHLDHFCRLSCR